MRIDIHVHLAGTGSHSDCILSERLRRTPAWYLMLVATGQVFHEVDDLSVLRHLVETLEGARLVDRAVFLALDMVFDRQGNPHPEATGLYTPNDYAADLADAEPKVLFGASVHPDRPGALDELDRVADRGAVLVKWIPSSMDADPLRPEYVPYYEKLAALGLPLLCHVGPEHAVPAPEPEAAYRAFDDPARLRPALDAGVTVIAAHCCTPVFRSDPDRFDDFVEMMAEADGRGWKLYADVSAFAAPLPHRVEYVARVRRELPQDRLILGSDYPIPVTALWPGAAGEIDVAEWAEAMLTANPLDRNVRMLRAFGFGEAVMTNAEKVLRVV